MTNGRPLIAGVLALLVLAGCSDIGRNEIRARRTLVAGERAVVIENSQVRVAVLPERGGRLGEYTLKATGRNELAAPPVDAALPVYDCVVAPAPDNLTVTLTWQDSSRKVERSHTLYPNSTRLHTRVVVTNLDNVAREDAAEMRPVFATGDASDNSVYVFQSIAPGDNVTLVRRVGAPVGEDFSRPVGTWAGILDTLKNEAVVEVFRAGVDELALRFDNATATVAPVQLARELKPGESTEMSFDMFILARKDLVGAALSLPVEAASRVRVASALSLFADYAKGVAAFHADDFYLAPWVPVELHLPPPLVVNDGPNGPCVLEDGVHTVGQEKANPGSNYKVRVEQKVIVAKALRDKIEASRDVEKDKFKPKYSEARWYLEAAERVAEDAAGNAPPAPSVYRAIEKNLAAARAALDPKAEIPKSGTFPRFYFSALDDSVQGWLVTLPDNYTASKTYPCLVWLHARDAENLPFDPEGRDPAVEALASSCAVVVMEPHGRGNLSWRGPAVEDVMTALEQARAEFSIEADRIYLMGESTGGGGTWWLGQRFPGVFAGIAPVAGPTDFRIGRDVDVENLPAWRRWWIRSNSAVSFAENLLNTAVYLYHGAADNVVSVEHSRRMVERFAELGHRDYVYEEDPGAGHETPSRLPMEMLDFLLDFRLDRAPKSLAVVSPYLRWARGGWARMDALDRPCEFGELHAKADGQTLAVRTANVTGFTLEPAKELLDLTKPFVVTIDGESAFLIESAASGSGRLTFRLESDAKTESPRWERGSAVKSARGALVKDASVEGPMSDVFRSRFILVPGTLGDNATTAACRAEAERYSREVWRARQHVDCLTKIDKDLTADDRRDANLVLLGSPDVNSVTKELAAALPVAFGKNGSVTIDNCTLSGPGAGVAFLYPNPNRPERGVLVVAPCATEDFRGILSTVRMDFDYYAFDSETARTGAWRDASSAVLFGFFDQKWKFDKRAQWSRPAKEPDSKLK